MSFEGLLFFLLKISKPTNPNRLGKSGREQDGPASHDDSSAAHSQANRNNRRLSGQVGGANIRRGALIVLIH